jgi:dUTP pyrophosphatase
MAKPVLKFKKLNPEAKIPQYAHDDDAGMDLFSLESFTLNPGERYVFQLGIAAEIPYGYFISIRDKSSVPSKFGIHCAGGVIDSGYRGEWAVIMMNPSKEAHTVEVGDKLAQAILQPVAHAQVEETEGELSETKRGAGGFGSTGRK